MSNVIVDRDPGYNVQESQAVSSALVQQQPILRVLHDGTEFQIKIDCVGRLNGNIIIIGWSSYKCDFTLVCDGRRSKPLYFSAMRHDVNSHLTLNDSVARGFVLFLTSCQSSNELHLEARLTVKNYCEIFTLADDDPDAVNTMLSSGSAEAALYLHALCLTPFSEEWKHVTSQIPLSEKSCPYAQGKLEQAVYNSLSRSVVVLGWVGWMEDAQLWIQDEHNNSYPLDEKSLYYRHDVQDTLGAMYPPEHAEGFVIQIQGSHPEGRITLFALSPSGLYTLDCIEILNVGHDVRGLAQSIFSVPASYRRFALMARQIYAPIIEELTSKIASQWQELPIVKNVFGVPPASPLLSIIIPLYGRYDFVDLQLMDFAADPWIKKNCEIIYVVDDSRIVEDFSTRAGFLHSLTMIPFISVWGRTNRGYAGANNLGAEISSADTLLFLNSDVFPKRAGWAQRLWTTLHSSPRNGVVGARLLRPEGSLQHIGMRFRFVSDVGVWMNEHPLAGCSPSMDPGVTPRHVPTVTGACLMVRRKNFVDVQGWDTGYLIGDFEDSDLCLKIRAQGLDIIYDPGATLTHLERQSFRLLGQEEFRNRVTVYNAVRHQEKWGMVLAQPVPNGGLTQERSR